jgi:SsrA-binding protein
MRAESIFNRKALRDYHILDRYEAGIELKGSEVKSIRSGKANISDAFARIENGEAFLYNADIQPYEKASHVNCCCIGRKSTSSTAKPR